MIEYPKIKSIFKRDERTHRVIEGDYSDPVFEYLYHTAWRWTEKIDGTNVRVMWGGEEETVRFGGRTENSQMPMTLVTCLGELFSTEYAVARFKETFGTDPACLYGEGYGAKIQKGGGRYIPNGQGFCLFDVRVGDWWLKWGDVKDVAAKMDIEVATEIGVGSLGEAVAKAKEGFRSPVAYDSTLQAEGLVVRPMVDLRTRRGQRVMGKIKYKDFPNGK